MIVTIEQLKQIRKDNPNKKIVIGLGSFDLLHWEHLQFVNDCKKQGDILVIALKHDAAVALKGEGRPIISEDQRAELIDNLKAVDYTVLTRDHQNFDEMLEKYNLHGKQEEIEWWTYFHEIFENLKPDVFVHQYDDYVQETRLAYLKQNNIKSVEREYRGIVTTSKIIKRVENLLKKEKENENESK